MKSCGQPTKCTWRNWYEELRFFLTEIIRCIFSLVLTLMPAFAPPTRMVMSRDASSAILYGRIWLRRARTIWTGILMGPISVFISFSLSDTGNLPVEPGGRCYGYVARRFMRASASLAHQANRRC